MGVREEEWELEVRPHSKVPVWYLRDVFGNRMCVREGLGK